MSLSSISTATYALVKYSRAYPSQTGANETDVTWQHYTNPVIQLVLDMKKSPAGELESYRVRVLWLLNAGPDTMDLDQREVVFVSETFAKRDFIQTVTCAQEDIDLLLFSSSATLESQRHNFAAHGLPLKAVYRDAVVGIRYMHPRVISKETTPVRRDTYLVLYAQCEP